MRTMGSFIMLLLLAVVPIGAVGVRAWISTTIHPKVVRIVENQKKQAIRVRHEGLDVGGLRRWLREEVPDDITIRSSVLLVTPQTRYPLFHIHGDDVDEKLFAERSLFLDSFRTLGASFRFQTRYYLSGVLEKHVLEGDLVIASSGDPTLDFSEVLEVIRELKLFGVDRISGDVILVDAPKENPSSGDHVHPGTSRIMPLAYYHRACAQSPLKLGRCRETGFDEANRHSCKKKKRFDALSCLVRTQRSELAQTHWKRDMLRAFNRFSIRLDGTFRRGALPPQARLFSIRMSPYLFQMARGWTSGSWITRSGEVRLDRFRKKELQRSLKVHLGKPDYSMLSSDSITSKTADLLIGSLKSPEWKMIVQKNEDSLSEQSGVQSWKGFGSHAPMRDGISYTGFHRVDDKNYLVVDVNFSYQPDFSQSSSPNVNTQSVQTESPSKKFVPYDLAQLQTFRDDFLIQVSRSAASF